MSDVLTAVDTTFSVDTAGLLDTLSVVKKAHTGSGDKTARIQFDAATDGVVHVAALINFGWKKGDAPERTVTIVNGDSMSATVRIDGDVTNAGIVAVPLDVLTKFLAPYTAAKMRKNPQRFAVTVTPGEVSFTVGSRTRVVKQAPVTPDPLAFDCTAELTVDADVLAEVLPATSSDVARPVLTAVAFDRSDVVACDSYRLHVVRGVTEVGEDRLLMPRALVKVASAGTGSLFVEWGAPQEPFSDRRVIQFTDAETGVVYRGFDISGDFPNYRGLIMRSPGRWAVVTAELRDAVDLLIAGGFGTPRNKRPVSPVRFRADGDRVDMVVSADGIGEETHRLSGPLRLEREDEFKANLIYLSDLLLGVESELIEWAVHEQKPMMFSEQRSGGGERIRLLMPCR